MSPEMMLTLADFIRAVGDDADQPSARIGDADAAEGLGGHLGDRMGELGDRAIAARRPTHELGHVLVREAGEPEADDVVGASQVGQRLGPPDPHLVARTAEDGARVPGQLEVVGRSPFTALPAGALLGLRVGNAGDWVPDLTRGERTPRLRPPRRRTHLASARNGLSGDLLPPW